jgi:tol-pal system protein YbgF
MGTPGVMTPWVLEGGKNMKRCGIFLALLLAGVLTVTFTIGCTAPKRATREEVTPRGDVDKLEARFDQFEKNYAAATRDIRTGQANLGADLGAVRDELRTLRGQVEGMDKSQNLKNQLDDLAGRVGNIENSLKKGKGETDWQRSEATDAVPSAEEKTDPKAAYNACYKLFKDGQNEKARDEFQKFLKQHPKTPYSGSAQFWIAETWYVDDKYEKAIVEYEKVIKGFPTSDKVPHALLKQGMSFQKLGDDGSAKIVYQQITKKYPQTQQAKVARARLSEMK